MEVTNIGVIGCGNISGIYFRNMARFQAARVIACADLDESRARAAAREHDIPMSLPVEALLAHADIELVLNLTVPRAHADVALAAVRAGKHVYSEKPLATARAEGQAVIREAAENGVRVGCAPDTFLGGAHQTCRALMDAGAIGEPVGASAFMLCHGHETWHPSPEFYYEVGGGPMMDMGPYYITALINLLGPVQAVTGASRMTFPERTITSQPKHGKVVTVETPTHIAGVLQFAGGAIGTVLMSFDVWHSTLPRIEVYGTEGSMLVPDPNGFGGKVLVRRFDAGEWHEHPLTHGFAQNARGIGVADMVAAASVGRPHRASGDLALHVLDVMLGVNDASEAGRHRHMERDVARPEPLPCDLFTERDGAWLISA